MDEKYNQSLEEIQSTTTANFNSLGGHGIKPDTWLDKPLWTTLGTKNVQF